MNRCPETAALFESELAHSDHCETCNAVTAELLVRDDDLLRALDVFANAGDPAVAVARAMAAGGHEPSSRPVPQGGQRSEGSGLEQWFHGSLVLVVALLVLVPLLWMRFGGGPAELPPEPVPAVPIEQQLAEEIALAKAIAETPWNELSAQAWGEDALELYDVARGIEEDFDLDDPAVQAILFDVWVAVGFAAESGGSPDAPLFGVLGTGAVNVGWYRAGALAFLQPDLLEGVNPKDYRPAINYYFEMIEKGDLPPHYGEPNTP